MTVPEVTEIKDAMEVYQTKLINMLLLKVLNKNPPILIPDKMVPALTLLLQPPLLTLTIKTSPLTHHLN